ncbi:MAG: SDR family oxidoreductase [Spirosomataceae bacterium]
MILVTGATGQLGGIVVENLLKKVAANEIAVLVRDENKAADLKAKGIDVRVGSYQDKASLATALQGIDKVLLISSNDFNDRIGQHKNVVDAAKSAGTKHIVYTGVTLNGIENSPIKPLLGDHFETEDYIKASGLTYTFLRNGLYQEVIPLFAGANVLETGIFFASGDGKVAFVSRADLAEAAANVLTTEGHENKVYHLTGSAASSFADVANELSAISGKSVGFVSPESDAFEAALKQFGLPDGIVIMSVLFAASIKHNDFDTVYADLETILGRKPTDLKTFLNATYKA